MDQVGEAELSHDMVKADIFMQIPVLGKENGAADEITHQGQHAAADKGLAGDRIAGQIDVGKTVQAAVSQLRPLGGDIQKPEERCKMQGDQACRRYHCRCAGRQHQNSQGDRQCEKGIPDAVFKIDKAHAQHNTEEYH